ncbi:MAG: TetR/AcrR family transcriptional regulator [Spirochaetaceae bacterium]|nr:MAG: TetR/AcrR family transcriptional regulator [Spirochaetaceae bacterium]
MSDSIGIPTDCTPEPATSSRDRLLEVAERLFMERGYSVIKLRDVADELGVRVASLYYHFPGGKQELFTEVLEQAMERMRRDLEEAIAHADASTLGRLTAAGRYFLTQHKIDVYRMLESDLDEIGAEDRAAIESTVYQSLMMPLVRVFASETVGADPAHAPLLAGSFLSIVQAIHHLPDEFGSPIPKDHMVEYMATLLVRGLDCTSRSVDPTP